MKTVVTGCAGFIGSHLAEKLINHGCKQITVLDNYSTVREDNLKHLSSHNGLKLVRADISKWSETESWLGISPMWSMPLLEQQIHYSGGDS